LFFNFDNTLNAGNYPYKEDAENKRKKYFYKGFYKKFSSNKLNISKKELKNLSFLIMNKK